MTRETVEAPLPGKVSKVHVIAGAILSEGDKVRTIESMKMGNPIPSPVSGRVVEVKIAIGQQVNGGQALVIVEH